MFLDFKQTRALFFGQDNCSDEDLHVSFTKQSKLYKDTNSNVDQTMQ